MKNKRLSILIVMVLVFGLSSLGNLARPTAAQPQRAKWTVMFYIAANNSLLDTSLLDLMELSAIGSSRDVNLVLQYTRPPNYQGFYGDWGGTRRYLITKSASGPSSGDFQVSIPRLTDYVTAIASTSPKVVSPDELAAFKKASVTEQETDAAALTGISNSPASIQLKNVQDLGTQVDSGDPATLAAFGAWAAKNYPADHYSLIVNDHGGAWTGVSSDDSYGSIINMPGLSTALAAITKATGQKLDFIDFDACLMTQLPVALTVQPYANYMIGSEESEPGTPMSLSMSEFAALVKNPAMTASDFGKVIVDTTIADDDAALKGRTVYDIGLIDLSKIGDVVTAIYNFNTAVKNAKDNDLKVVSTARSRVQAFSVAEEEDYFSTIDLSDLMTQIGSQTADNTVKQTATAVSQAVDKAVLYYKQGGLPGAKGLSVYFPKDSPTFYNVAQGRLYRIQFSNTLGAWQDFLDTYYAAASRSAGNDKPVIQITQNSDNNGTGSFQNPPSLAFTLNGKNLNGVTVVVSSELSGPIKGTIAVALFPFRSNTFTVDGQQINDFPDGQTNHTFYWDARVTELTDVTTHSAPVMVAIDPKDDQYGTIKGIYTDSINGKQWSNSRLNVDLTTMTVSSVSVSEDTAGKVAPTILTPNPGDTFEPVFTRFDFAGSIDIPSGDSVTFGKFPLTLSYVPAPDGTYVIDMYATDAAGNLAPTRAVVKVKNSGLNNNLIGFKAPEYGLSFLYPWDWHKVAFQEGGFLVPAITSGNKASLVVLPDTSATAQQDVSSGLQANIKTVNPGAKIGQPTAIKVGKYTGTSVNVQTTDANGTTTQLWVGVYVPETATGYIFVLASDKLDANMPTFNQILQSVQFSKLTK